MFFVHLVVVAGDESTDGDGEDVTEEVTEDPDVATQGTTAENGEDSIDGATDTTGKKIFTLRANLICRFKAQTQKASI